MDILWKIPYKTLYCCNSIPFGGIFASLVWFTERAWAACEVRHSARKVFEIHKTQQANAAITYVNILDPFKMLQETV